MDLTINWFISQLRINQEWNRIIIHVCNWVEIGYLTPLCNGDTNFNGPIPHPIFSETANMETWHSQPTPQSCQNSHGLRLFVINTIWTSVTVCQARKPAKTAYLKACCIEDYVEAKDKFEWRMKGYRNTNFAQRETMSYFISMISCKPA